MHFMKRVNSNDITLYLKTKKKSGKLKKKEVGNRNSNTVAIVLKENVSSVQYCELQRSDYRSIVYETDGGKYDFSFGD